MRLSYIDGNDLLKGVKAGCIKLENNREKVNLLNIFPVPDGDTGTNMYLTLRTAVREGEKNYENPLGQIAKAISRGSLMGARGNSGVILSQVFRGVARVLEEKEQADALDLASALKSGSETAYKAVMKPVEGTMLTVIRETAEACEKAARQDSDVVATLLAGIKAGYATLEKTPDMLPILKEAGVVDAGGQGFLLFLKGLLEGLAQEKEIPLDSYQEEQLLSREERVRKAVVELEFQYCTEMLLKGEQLNPEEIKSHLRPLGDSIVVIGGDDNMVKVHIHSNHPGEVLETCLQWGSLSDIKINNMLEEVHEHLKNWGEVKQNAEFDKEIGVVAVAGGEGVVGILKSLGVDAVVEGGQTFNPSTEDLLNAYNKVNAKLIIVLPNNSNVIMAARQAGDLCDKDVRVIPTKSVMQAIAALMVYEQMGDIDQIYEAMLEEIKNIKYAEVTYAVRDSSINGLDIKEGDAIGIVEDEIELTADNAAETVEKLLAKMVESESQLITVIYGSDVTEEEALQVQENIAEIYPDCEIELYHGGQPYYNYLISVE